MFINWLNNLLPVFGKVQSRKFMVWAVATIALFTSYIDSTQWEMLTLLYIGVQAGLDYAKPQPTIKEITYDNGYTEPDTEPTR